MRYARLKLTLIRFFLVFSAATATASWLDGIPSARRPSLYRVVGYFDQAPAGVPVRDRISVYARGHANRTLIISDYHAQAEPDISSRLSSRMLGQDYGIRGPEREVARLFDIPGGKPFAASLHFHPGVSGAPSLYIADLEDPVEEKTPKAG